MAKRLLAIFVLILLALLPWTTHTGTAATTYEITRISLAPDGTGSNSDSYTPDVSGDGRYIVFSSAATNLIEGDTNGVTDVFVYDRQTDTMSRVSIATGGAQGNGASTAPAISVDGRYVAFASDATNLVGDDTNGLKDVFVHDRQMGTTARVSVATGGTEASGNSDTPALSADGRYVAFASTAFNLVDSDTNSYEDVFVHDRQADTTTRVSVATDGTEGNNDSRAPALSGDGNWVAFESKASNLVEDDTNYGLYAQDVFVHDRQTGETTIVSVSSAGGQGNNDSGTPALSADGRYVVFDSLATSLAYGTSGFENVFLRDRQTGTTVTVSVAPGQPPARSPAISADGRWITYESNCPAPGEFFLSYDIFLYDRQTAQVTQLTGGSDDGSYASVLSADGTVVAFSSDSSVLVPGDTDEIRDIFLWAPATRYLVFLPLTVRGN